MRRLSFFVHSLEGVFFRRMSNLSPKPRVLISHNAIPQVAIDILKDKFDTVVVKGTPNPTREELLQLIQGCSAALWYGHIKVDREMVDAAGDSLKIVAHSGAGYDHIDVTYLKEKGIICTNAANVLGPAVAEIAIALTLEVSRRTLEGYKAITSGTWLMNHATWMTGHGLSNKTVGIIGLGQNGFAIAKRIVGFEIGRLLYNDLTELEEKARSVNAEFVSKEVIFKESDFLYLCVPLNNETRFLVNKETLSTMKNTSILINTSRGEVVNQDDLIEALQKNIIYGAGLDVMYPEPLPQDHILTKLPTCALTPHIGSRTFENRKAMYILAAQNIYNALTGQPVLTPVV
uniref:Glyoxylate reductase/hydroxypyruvate reductase n=1 Tax=Homalodisca liturata TaxID=320908 RepID=A0A1B6HUG5_9HEMI